MNGPAEYSSAPCNTMNPLLYNCLSLSRRCVWGGTYFSICVDLAALRVVMEDVASGASWPEESWFNEHHWDREMTAPSLLNLLIYWITGEKLEIHVTLKPIEFIITSASETQGTWRRPRSTLLQGRHYPQTFPALSYPVRWKSTRLPGANTSLAFASREKARKHWFCGISRLNRYSQINRHTQICCLI